MSLPRGGNGLAVRPYFIEQGWTGLQIVSFPAYIIVFVPAALPAATLLCRDRRCQPVLDLDFHETWPRGTSEN